MSGNGVCRVLQSAMMAGLLFWPAIPAAQEGAADPSLSDSVRELRQQIQELKAAVSEVRSEAQQYRAETVELRRELAAMRAQSNPQSQGATESASAIKAAPAEQTADAAANREEHASRLDEQYQLLSGKIDEQYQTKVESASRYRVRLSGIVLLNLFGNLGTVDNIDYPAVVYDHPPGVSDRSAGATLRQSQIGLEVFGPQMAGARTRADLVVDLAGGFPRAQNGINAGLLRLRTGTMRMDWAHTSIVGGQDGLFFSPASPTSFATLAEPALAYAGNLWAWAPQIRVEHRFSLGDDSTLVVQGGILDPQSGEAPQLTYYRQPQAAERSGVPAFATRVAWTRTLFGQPLRVGAGGYYNRQDYGFNRNVDGWVGAADWEVPLSHAFSVSGKLYRGRALGGLGVSEWRSVLFSGDPGAPDTQVRAINTAGGWAQLKYRPVSKLEFNGAFGEDAPYMADLRAFAFPQAYGDPTLSKNQGSLFNVIYRPRSDLLFSAEYRHLKTYTTDNGAYSAGHVNLTMGVMF